MQKRLLSVMMAILFAALATQAFAAQKKSAVTAPPQARPLTVDGRLNSLPKMPDGEVRVGLSASGKLIVPQPYDETGRLSTDPAALARWEATAKYVSDNLPHLERVLGRLSAEARTLPGNNAFEYMNQGLRAHLNELGAAEEIERLDATMIHKIGLDALQSNVVAGSLGKGLQAPGGGAQVMGSCGPRGTCLTSVIVCTGDGPGEPTDCSVIDCQSQCGSCCGYGVRHLQALQYAN